MHAFGAVDQLGDVKVGGDTRQLISVVARQMFLSDEKVDLVIGGYGDNSVSPAMALIMERKRYIVTFTAPRTIQISRWDFAQPVSPAPVVIYTETLPADVSFQVVAGVPGGNTPDGFGNASRAIDFGQGIGLGGLNYVVFMPDGSAQDQNQNLNSGVIYMSRNNDLYSSRAMTVYGATGRLRGWQLVNQGGAPTWVQK